MSFKTALASCWDICKRNCTNDGSYFWLNSLRDCFLGFRPNLYETYYDFSDDRDYPYSDKPRRSNSSCHRGITELDDKLVSSFLGWIFAIPEMLVWLSVAVGMAVMSVLALLLLVVTALLAPIFLSIRNLGIYLDYTRFLGGTWEILRNLATFALFSFLRVPYHLIKALIRIPAGIVVAVREIISPSPVAIPQPIASSLPASQPIVNSDELNQSQYSRVLYPSPLTPAIQPHAQGRSEFESDEEDSSDEDGDMENQRYDQDMDEQFSFTYQGFIYQGLIADAIESEYRQLLQDNPHLAPEYLLRPSTLSVTQSFPQGIRLLSSQTRGSSGNDDLQTAIDISFNERPPSSVSEPIQRREPKTNWCEQQLDKLGFTNRPERYICVISGALMNPPFLVGDGNLYNEDSIETYFDTAGRKSPITREMPFTDKSGIALETVKNEIVSFMIAVRANYHLDKIQGKEEKNSGTKAVLKIAEDIEKKASILHEEINKYVKKRHTSDRLTLARKMINDKAFMTTNDEAMISTSVIAKAWGHIKALTEASDNPNFSMMSPTNAIAHFFMMIKGKDASFDNLIINVLREAMLEEQKVSQAYDATWISEQGRGIAGLGDELSTRLNQYLPDEKPQKLDDVAERIQQDQNISDKALQYALLLIKDPEKAVNFDQFEPEKKERLITINAFLETFYAPENAPLKPVFLMTLKEIILREEMALKESSNFSEKVCFGSVLQQGTSQENENRDLGVVGEVSFAKGM